MNYASTIVTFFFNADDFLATDCVENEVKRLGDLALNSNGQLAITTSHFDDQDNLLGVETYGFETDVSTN